MLGTILSFFLFLIVAFRFSNLIRSFPPSMIPTHRRRNPRLQRPLTPPVQASNPEDFSHNDIERAPRSLDDILQTALILRQALIPDLVPDILNNAEYWLKTTNARTEDVGIHQSQAGFVYLRSQRISVPMPHAIRRVEFKITSHDQGWADNPSHSWTWFEAGIEREPNHEPDGDSEKVTMKKRLCENVAASREKKTHTIVWDDDAEDEEEREWLRALKTGDSVLVTVHARFPGWINNVQSAEINVYTAGVKR